MQFIRNSKFESSGALCKNFRLVAASRVFRLDVQVDGAQIRRDAVLRVEQPAAGLLVTLVVFRRGGDATLARYHFGQPH